MAAFDSSAFSTSAFSVNAFDFGNVPPPAPPTEEQASNWQADYWKRKTKKEREEEERMQRILLGILPPPLQVEAESAVREVLYLNQQVASAILRREDQIRMAMEAREAYENVYRRAYAETYIAEAVAEKWRGDMKRIQRKRRSAALLLLH